MEEDKVAGAAPAPPAGEGGGTAPPPPPEAEPAAPPPPEPAAAPPPPEKAESAPPPPPPASVCTVCGGKLYVSAGCGLCLTCRFKHSNPFLPVKELLSWGMLKAQTTNVFNAELVRLLDVRTGRLGIGHMIEARCLRVDAPEWRYELGHSWPSGMSLFVDDHRVMIKKPDEENDEAPPGPFDLTGWVVRSPLEVNPRPLRVTAAITAKKSEQWALGLVLLRQVGSDEQICKQVAERQAPVEERMKLDLERIFMWVTEHRPDRVSKKDTLRNVEPPVMKLTCCTSLSRIERAARGPKCEHLQCFDLASYVHTMRKIPPKHAWCCPICDRPAPLQQLRLDAFAQSVLDATEANVTEVLVADNGKWEVSATEEHVEDASSDDGPLPCAPPTQADLQQAALNLGRAFSAPAAPPPAAASRPASDRSRSPRRTGGAPGRGADRGASAGGRSGGRGAAAGGPPGRGAAEAAASPAADEVDHSHSDKMHIWEKLQGIAKPEPKKEETRFGWLPEGARCSKCEKTVVDRGGVYCGRKRPGGECGGCFAEICWKCMNKGNKDEIGAIRTSKTEFSSIGPDAWWMHEKCMTTEDKRAYFGEEDEDMGKAKSAQDSDDEHPGKFAWE